MFSVLAFIILLSVGIVKVTNPEWPRVHIYILLLLLHRDGLSRNVLVVFGQIHTLFRGNLVHGPDECVATIEYSSNFFQRKTLCLDKGKVDDEEENSNEDALNDVVFPGNGLEADWIDVSDLERGLLV